MPDYWTVKDLCTPLAAPSFSSDPALIDGNPFSFWRGDQLTCDTAKTVPEEQDGVILREWLWLADDGHRAGYVPFNPSNPDAFGSVAVPWEPGTPALDRINLFNATISEAAFAEACVRKAIRWNTNAAYLFALAFVESGSDWPQGEVSSPAVKEGQLSVGTFQFLPAAWKALVEKHGADQFISPEDIIFPQPQTTFAAAQSGDAAEELEKLLERKPRYVDLYLAHLFTIAGCVKLLMTKESDPSRTIDALLDEIYADLDDTRKVDRIKSILARKAHLLLNEGKPLSTAAVEANCIADLDRGFAHVRQVADRLVGQTETSAGDAIGMQVTEDGNLGILSEEFESNGDAGAIGFDSTGGFSYGAWQIATRTGTFSKFLNFLGSNTPELKTILDAAGGVNGAQNGTDKFKNAWRGLKSSTEFLAAQHRFIRETHYEVMVKGLRNKMDIATQPSAIRNVIWSVAVQHGPKSRIVALCTDEVGINDPAKLINRIYDERSKVNVYFRRSKAKVKQAVLARFRKERAVALQMLKNELSAQ